MELKDLPRSSLLDSFESPLIDDDFVDSEDDERLDNDGNDTTNEGNVIDRNIHNSLNNAQETVNEASSLRSPESDLENQTPIIRMTKTQRVMNVLNHLVPIKQTYERITNGLMTGRMQSNVPGRFVGQGTDGVFRNLMAKPESDSAQVKNETNPPTYEEAAADSSPEYWETSVIAPIYEDEVFVEGLPVGNVANFVWNGLVTVAFQFVGFLLCYLLHTSHAAKHGSRGGLGITFIFYGWNLVPANFGNADELPEKYEPQNPNNFNVDGTTAIGDAGIDDYGSSLNHIAEEPENQTPYFAYGLIAFGLLLIFKAFWDYFRVKQMERVILYPPGSSSSTTTYPTTNDNDDNDNDPSWNPSSPTDQQH